MRNFIVSALVFFAGCGSVPYPKCKLEFEQICVDGDSDGINDVAMICDGDNYIPFMRCNEFTDDNGDTLDMNCIVDEKNAYCREINE